MDTSSESIGRIFDIRRFSIHDGDGIRTTVFLKGCPLRCVWCQNPEGISLQSRLIYLENQCIHCGLCAKACNDNAIRFQNGKLHIDREIPNQWEEVIDVCPAACLMMDCKFYSVEKLMELLLRDEAFFEHGGGVTLSGGEPLLQKNFIVALLKALKLAGIHTAIETSLYVAQDDLRDCLPYLDLIYADFKIYDTDNHKKWTGVDNIQIRDNIRFLLNSEKRDQVIIRTPLIPELTATKENIQAISCFISDLYPGVKYELLNYNPLAKAKYNLIGREYCFFENPGPYSECEMDMFRAFVREAGVWNIIS